jgi:hypothetical protein
MAVGKKMAVGAAIFSAALLAGVRNDVGTRAELPTPLTTAQAVKRLGPLVNDGAPADQIAVGFHTTEDFAATVHASRNIRVPFTVLKRQVVDAQKPLAAAIQTVKPTAHASLEADLARSEARADLAAIE